MGRQVWVTTTVAGPPDRLWHLTRDTDPHPRWDRRFGPLVGYRGWFTCSYPEAVGDAVPASVKPLREERRR
jgi:hypothetical protein